MPAPHRFYKLAIWHKSLRPAQLRREPLCRYCKQEGLITPATVVDHIEPHKGDWDRFADADNLQSMCKQHHDSAKQREERQAEADAKRGYSTQTGADGFPIDPQHPVWGKQ